MKTILAAVLILLFGGWAVYTQTDGLTVLTTEAARRQAIVRQPAALPDARMELADGSQPMLADILEDDGRIAIVNFMFTRCTSVCIQMADEFQQLQAAIRKQGLQDRVRLISISFDPRDTAEWLGRYQKRMQADPAIWQAVLAVEDDARKQLLERFGIIVVPAPLGQFEHNTAYHVVTADGHLTRIVDIDNADVVLYYAARQSGRTEAPLS